MKEQRLDRTAFWAGSKKEQDARDAAYWKEKTVNERMQAAWYLTCKAYGIDPENPPKMERKMTYAGKLKR